MVKGLFLDLGALVKETKETGRFYTENIRNVYGLFIEDIKSAQLDGTVQEIVHTMLSGYGVSKGEVDAKMELFINELPYAYYNVAGHDNMDMAEGAEDALDYYALNTDFVMGIATPVIEMVAKNMFERTGMDAKVFKFSAYGGFGRDANGIFVGGVDDARMLGVDGANHGVFVSSSPHMLSAARFVGLKTIAVIGGSADKFEGVGVDAKIKTFKELRKAVSKVLV